MNNGHWFVWTGGRAGGMFRTFQDAHEHCRILANDHRRKQELHQLAIGAYRYVGPRGARHGTRLVAFLCTMDGADLIGLRAVGVADLERRAS